MFLEDIYNLVMLSQKLDANIALYSPGLRERGWVGIPGRFEPIIEVRSMGIIDVIQVPKLSVDRWFWRQVPGPHDIIPLSW